MDIKNIIIGKGAGPVEFGMTRDMLKEILGEPDEIDSYDDEGNSGTEAWHYDDLELSVSFDEDEHWRLSTMAVSSEEFSLKGELLIGLERADLISKIKALHLGKPEFEELDTDDEQQHELICVEAVSINFWLEDGVLSEIHWGPLFDEDDEMRQAQLN
jgi:hypothetical protein